MRETLDRTTCYVIGVVETSQWNLTKPERAIAIELLPRLARHSNCELRHALRVADLAFALATSVGAKRWELEAVRCGALLHDVGKLWVPSAILNKPGPLLPEERSVIRLHPAYSATAIGTWKLRGAEEAAHCHHERWDGNGYPSRLRRRQIGLAGRCLAIADFWDAVLSSRSYRLGFSRGWAIARLTEGAGVQFDPVLVNAFLERVVPQG